MTGTELRSLFDLFIRVADDRLWRYDVLGAGEIVFSVPGRSCRPSGAFVWDESARALGLGMSHELDSRCSDLAAVRRGVEALNAVLQTCEISLSEDGRAVFWASPLPPIDPEDRADDAIVEAVEDAIRRTEEIVLFLTMVCVGRWAPEDAALYVVRGPQQ